MRCPKTVLGFCSGLLVRAGVDGLELAAALDSGSSEPVPAAIPTAVALEEWEYDHHNGQHENEDEQ